MTRKDARTFGQKAADVTRRAMGSWPFVFGFIIAMGCWAYLNSVILKNHPFDPYPYVFLNLMLSTMAGLQGAILLIAAKRADAIMDAIIHHILENTNHTLRAEQNLSALVEQNTKLTRQVHYLAKQIHTHIEGS